MSTFELQIVTPERLVYSGPAVSAVVPAADGQLGILAHHAPLLASLGEGPLTVRAEGGVRSWVVRGGIVEVHENIVSVLADEVVE